jgi:hypothetical protein
MQKTIGVQNHQAGGQDHEYENEKGRLGLVESHLPPAKSTCPLCHQ